MLNIPTSLLEAFTFSEADLMMNRQGKLGEGQKQSLSTSRKWRIIAFVAYAAMIALFVLACLGVGISLLLNRDSPTTRLAIMGGMLIATLLVSAGAANYYFRTRELLAARISSLEGPVKISARTV